MRIQLTDVGKRFNRDWIFRNINFTFLPQKSYAITGINGSGKSTLLQMLAGSTAASSGAIEWQHPNAVVDANSIYQHIAITAPYLELIEEMTAIEFLSFHKRFKPFVDGVSTSDMLAFVELSNAATKQIRNYSSGMKQRLKLAQAIFSNTPLLLLDEPCTNLDSSGYDLFHRLINDYTKDKLTIVSSNDANEYAFCEEVLNMMDYRTVL